MIRKRKASNNNLKVNRDREIEGQKAQVREERQSVYGTEIMFPVLFSSKTESLSKNSRVSQR